MVAAGTPDEVAGAEGSFTADYLSGRRRIEVPEFAIAQRGAIKLTGACENNLKNVSISVELGTLTVVTGVSVGQSSLITDTLRLHSRTASITRAIARENTASSRATGA